RWLRAVRGERLDDAIASHLAGGRRGDEQWMSAEMEFGDGVRGLGKHAMTDYDVARQADPCGFVEHIYPCFRWRITPVTMGERFAVGHTGPKLTASDGSSAPSVTVVTLNRIEHREHAFFVFAVGSVLAAGTVGIAVFVHSDFECLVDGCGLPAEGSKFRRREHMWVGKIQREVLGGEVSSTEFARVCGHDLDLGI